MKKALFILICLCTVFSFSSADTDTEGENLYNKHCKKCHGKDGTKGLAKAKDLQKSVLKESEVFNIIKNGKGKMAAYEKKMNDKEIRLVTQHVKSLRK